MKGYNFTAGKEFEADIPALDDDSRLLVICNSSELYSLLDIFGWDMDTVDECTNLDEKIRYTNYDGYDFISMIYAEPEGDTVLQREVNIFFSEKYLTLVLPESPGENLSKLADITYAAVPLVKNRPVPLIHLYYSIFDNLTSFYSDSLEEFENRIETMTESIEIHPKKDQITHIISMRKMAYTYKKLLRALSYVGDQVLVDDNGSLDRSELKHFRGINTRLAKLYDFADNLYDMSNDLLNLYDSKSAAQMNKTVNKLTIITLFFSPPALIAGIYGMNFIHMPERNWYLGYPVALVYMLMTVVVIYIILKRKKWL